MNFFKKLGDMFLASDTVVETATKGIYNGLDKAIFTKEEQSESEERNLDRFLKFLELTKNSSPARRQIAMIVMSLWFLVGVNILILLNINLILVYGFKLEAMELGDILEWTQWYIAAPTGTVLTFYFWVKVKAANRETK